MADMKQNIDKIIKSVCDTAGNIYSKADTQKEALKLRHTISKRAEELSTLYTELGITVEKARVALDGDLGDHVDMLYMLIDSKKEEITAAKKQLDLILGVSRCPKCSREVGGDMSFCPYCGSELGSEAFSDMVDEDAEVADDIADIEDI